MGAYHCKEKELQMTPDWDMFWDIADYIGLAISLFVWAAATTTMEEEFQKELGGGNPWIIRIICWGVFVFLVLRA